MNRVTKMVLLTALFSLPYYFWIFWNIANHRMERWYAMVGLIYLLSTVTVLVFIHKALYRKELAESMKASTATPAHIPQVIWISSIDHLKRFRDLPWYSKWFGFLPAGFPKVKVGVQFSPLVYFSQANLKLTQDKLICEAFFPADTALKSYANLSSGLRLMLSPDQLSSVSRFDMRQVLPTALPLPFMLALFFGLLILRIQSEQSVRT